MHSGESKLFANKYQHFFYSFGMAWLALENQRPFVNPNIALSCSSPFARLAC